MLAIVIPYFKVTFFEETINSLAGQTNKNFKVYIGDDASPECPKKILKEFESKLNFKYQKFENNLGSISLVQQWNRCIDLIEDEEWIMILGDDDFLEETVVENWYKNYEDFNKKSNVIRFATKDVYEETSIISKKIIQPKWEKAIDAFYRRNTGLTGSTLSEYVFSKEIYSDKGFVDYPLAWHSDEQAWLDFSDEKPIYTINESVVFVRLSTINITGKKDNFGLKNKATLLFQKNFISKYLYFLPKPKRLHYLLIYETTLKINDKLDVFKWRYLFKMYLSNFKLKPFLKFIRRFILSIIRYKK
ncbi:MAG: hypothetical protein ACI9SI_001345 [Polaribacter sp.]|jgi:hypothetical protein